MRHLLAIAVLSVAVAAHAGSEPSTPHRVVQVAGQGEATVAPDRARIAMAVEARNLQLAAAEAKANEGTRAAVAAFKSLGLKEADINTAGYSVNAEFDWINGKQKFKGYLAVRQIELTVRDLSKIGDVLLSATQSGINNVQPPQLEASQAKATERTALGRATEDAVAQARVIAEALGMKLGSVRTINANAEMPQPQPMREMKVMMAMDAAPAGMSGNEQMGFSAGLITSRASVTAEFELTP